MDRLRRPEGEEGGEELEALGRVEERGGDAAVELDEVEEALERGVPLLLAGGRRRVRRREVDAEVDEELARLESGMGWV